ncbi:hypothetical protein [Pedobacter sp. ASV12]|uniref:hypothetical protein n=1 Tax=Pedobacter sp. ASV12 TaxID=2795120 RepID=UPI0018ECEAE2|nr:hypothetical protein [Pedobacter sp. ASV12]
MGIEVYFILFFLALGLSLFWSLVFRSAKNTVKKRIIIVLLTLASAPAVYLGLAMLLIAGMTYHPNRDFDQERWKSEPDKRYELTKNLINSQVLIGKNKSEVIAILGKESSNKADEDLWHYDIGFVASIGNIDPDILEIKFKNGRVISARQIST